MSSETVGVKVAGFFPVDNCLISYVDGEVRSEQVNCKGAAHLERGRACCTVLTTWLG